VTKTDSAPLSHRNQKSQYKINPDFFAIFGASKEELKPCA
jgi:hypothetical protein